MSVRLGYACISVALRARGIFTSRTLTLKTLEEKGVAAAKKLAKQNIADLMKIIQYNEDVGIRFFRITSNLFPHMENPKASRKYAIDFAKADLRLAGDMARAYGHRMTMHPGQYVQLGSPRKDVVDQSIRDLALHAKIFEHMGLTPGMGSVMVIHGGGSYGSKEEALARWEENFRRMPEAVRRYVVLENDEWQYSVLDLIPLCERNGIPLCVDFFHHQVGHADQFDVFDPALVQRVVNTWKLRGIKPKCHWSSQAVGERKGTHGDCVDEIPQKILDVCKEHGVDIMIEAKMKDACVMKMLGRHFAKNTAGARVLWTVR